MTAVASPTSFLAQPALEERSSPLRRSESYVFHSSQNVERNIPDTPLGRDGSVAPYYECRWNDTGETVPAPPSTPPPPLPAFPPPSASSTPSPPPPPSTKSATPKSILKPPVRITGQRDAASASVDNYIPKIPLLSAPYPPPCPISIPYGSYICFDPPEDPKQSIQIPVGSTITHLSRRLLVTKEYLATIIDLSESAPEAATKYKRNGIYVRLAHCIQGPPIPLPDKNEAMRLSATRDPIPVDIPREIREANEKRNKKEKWITIPTDRKLMVVLHGKMYIVRVAALSKVNMGYSKVPVQSRQGYLQGLGVRGQKRKWDDSLGELGELEVVRDKENLNMDGERKRKRKRVKYWAEGIDENQVAKGTMKTRKMIEWLKRKEAEKKEEEKKEI